MGVGSLSAGQRHVDRTCRADRVVGDERGDPSGLALQFAVFLSAVEPRDGDGDGSAKSSTATPGDAKDPTGDPPAQRLISAPPVDAGTLRTW